MAKQKSKESASSWVDQIAADPANVPAVRLLCGYPGKSPEKDCRRIYLHPDLSDWVDVPAQDVLHEEAVRDASPSGLAHVWVKRQAAEQAEYPQPQPPIYAASTLNMRDCQPYTAYCQSQTCIAPTGRHPAPPPPGYPHPHPHPGFWWCPTIPYRGC